MAMVTFPGGGMPFPSWPSLIAGQPDITNLGTALSAATHKMAAIYQSSVAKSIRYVWIRTGTVTTGATVDVRVETVDPATGSPTGTLWAANTNTALVIANGDDAVWLRAGPFTADATLAVGDTYAIVLVNGAVPGNFVLVGFSDMQNTPFPYRSQFVAAWARGDTVPLFFPEYSDGSFAPIFGVSQVGDITEALFNSGSATNRRGNVFTLTCAVRTNACWVWSDVEGDYSVRLYDTDGTTLLATTGTIDKEYSGQTTAGLHHHVFTSTVDLALGGPYYLVLVPETVTNTKVSEFTAPAAGILDMFPGGTDCHRVVYTGGAWVETAAARTYVGLYLTGFDAGVVVGGETSSVFVS